MGASLYETLNRKKRDLKKKLSIVGSSQTWGEEEWLDERIMEYYGPATWVQDRSWGYRTPIYLLNRLIRLQAIVEILSNHTSEALELLSKQHSQMQAFVYQNRIDVEYLLAEEGGVCGKFNESECCIETFMKYMNIETLMTTGKLSGVLQQRSRRWLMSQSRNGILSYRHPGEINSLKKPGGKRWGSL